MKKNSKSFGDIMHFALKSENIGIWSLQISKQEALFSNEWFEMLGYQIDELEHKYESWEKLIHPDDIKRITESLDSFIQSNHNELIDQFRMLQKNGSWAWVQSKARTYKFDSQGKKEQLVFVQKNITNEKEAQEKNKLQEKILHIIYNHNYQLIGLLNPDGILLSANSSSLAMIQCNEEEVLGKYFWETPWWNHTLELQEKLKDSIKKASQGEFVRFEAVHQDKKGKNKYIDFSLQPVFNEQQEVIYIIPEGRDISTLKAKEAELEESNQKYQMLVKNMNDCIWEIDKNGFYIYTSPKVKDILGYEPEEIIGMNAFDLMDPDEAEKVASEYNQYIEKGLSFNGLINVNRHKNGRKVILESIGFPIKDANGEILFYRGIDRDITEKVKLQDLMIQNDKMMSLGGLASGMAHEINNPLGMILQGIQNTFRRIDDELHSNRRVAESMGISLQKLKAYLGERNVLKYLEGIKEAAQRSAKIIKNMLQFSRKSNTKETQVDVSKLIHDTLNIIEQDYSFEDEYDFKHIQVDLDIPEKMPLLTCKPTEIQQVLLNIIKNAAQALNKEKTQGKEARIKISVSVSNSNELEISIIDNGPGIDKNYRKHLFEPFFTTRKVGEGTGLGLTIAYFIVQKNHQGRLLVESKPGRGSTFTIQLPINGINKNTQQLTRSAVS